MKNKLHALLFTRGQQKAFFEDLLMLSEDGVSMRDALGIMVETYDDNIAVLAQKLQDTLAAGKSLASGMQGWVPATILTILETGEKAGTLNDALRACAQACSERSMNRRVWITALSYPLTIFVLALVVMLFIRQAVFASFIEIKPLAAWPALSQWLYHFADFIAHSWCFMLADVALLSVSCIILCTQYAGRLRSILDVLPPFSLYRQAVAAGLLQTLAILLQHGVMVKEAFILLTYGASPFLKSHLQRMQTALDNGTLSLADVLDSGLIERNDVLRLRVVANSRGMNFALSRLAKHAAERQQRNNHQAAKRLSVALFLMAAAMACIIIFSVYSLSTVIAH